MLSGAYVVARGCDGADKVIHLDRLGQEGAKIIVQLVVILMERDIVHVLVNMIEDCGLPGAEGRHHTTGAATGHKLDAGVYPLHSGCRLRSQPAVLVSRLAAYLPGTVHLVAEAPGPD